MKIEDILNPDICKFLNKYKFIFMTILILAVCIGFLLYYYVFKDEQITRHQVGVIVRSTGERTEQETVRRLKALFGEKNVYLIKNVYPLAEASKQTILLAKTIKKKWILVVDADVILFDDKIIKFIKDANKISKKDKYALSFQGRLLDNLMFKTRYVGFILYNNKNLKYRIRYWNICHNQIQPEACTRHMMNNEGYKSYQLNDTKIGLHGFFQYKKDILKDSILLGKKHNLVTALADWEAFDKKTSYEDYNVFIKGLKISKTLNSKNVIPDDKEIEKMITGYNITEEPLTEEELRNLIDSYIYRYNNSGTFTEKE